MAVEVRRLGPDDLPLFRAVNRLFGDAFDDQASYRDRPPSDAYARALLADPHVIALAAMVGGAVVGALTAYELRKLEQERSELYIYDLAVDEAHRRRGIATALIDWLRIHAGEVGAWTIYVQADPPDAPAIALYDKLGRREEVLHFDIPPAPGPKAI